MRRHGVGVPGVLAMAGIVGISAATIHLTWPHREPGHSPFAPQDGVASAHREGEAWVTHDHAITRGAPMAESGPEWAVLSLPEFKEVLAANWWLQFTTRTEGSVVSHGTVLRLLREGRIERTLSMTDDGEVHLFSPPLLELPADPHPGDTWSSSGMLRSVEGTEGSAWHWQARADTPEDDHLRESGCLVVTGTLTTGDHQEDRGDTWCPGRGVVPDSQGESPLPPLDLSDDTEWSPTSWTHFSDPLTPPAPLIWHTGLAPVGRGDLLVLAHETSEDLIFSRLPDPSYRAHPGGDVLTLGRRGDLVLTTTTTPALVAHDLQGRRRWQRRLAEVVPVEPAFSGDRILVQDATSTITVLDAHTGNVIWETFLDDPPRAAPIWCGEHAVVATAEGVVGLDGDDGGEDWEVDLPEPTTDLACVAGRVVSLGLSRIDLLSPSGQRLSTASLPPQDTLRAGFDVTGVLVARTTQGLRGYSVDGGRIVPLWTEAGDFVDVASDGRVLAALTRKRLEVFDATGNLVDSWRMQTLPGDGEARLGVTDRGVVSLGSDGVLRGTR